MKNPESALALLLIIESMLHRERVIFRASDKLCEKYGQEVNIEVYKTRLPYDETKFNITINLVDTNGDLLKNSEGKPATKARNQHLFDEEYTELVYGMVNPKNITKNRKTVRAEIPINPIKIKPEGWVPKTRGRKPNPDKLVLEKSNKNLGILDRLIPMDEISEQEFQEKHVEVPVIAEIPKATRKKKPEVVVVDVPVVVAEIPKATRKKIAETVSKVSEKVGTEVSKPEVVATTKKPKAKSELALHLEAKAKK